MKARPLPVMICRHRGRERQGCACRSGDTLPQGAGVSWTAQSAPTIHVGLHPAGNPCGSPTGRWARSPYALVGGSFVPLQCGLAHGFLQGLERREILGRAPGDEAGLVAVSSELERQRPELRSPGGHGARARRPRSRAG